MDKYRKEKKVEDLVYVKEGQFSDETISALVELGNVLRDIDKRLASEGYIIVDGQLKKLGTIEF